MPVSTSQRTEPILRSACGEVIPLRVGQWRAAASACEHDVVADLPAPVLDVGCGPGRWVAAVTAKGRPALGIDTSPSAVAEAAARGVPTLQRNVFSRLPAEGRWRSVLLVDGNIGIGGDPVLLLRRVRQLLAPGGVVVVEVEGSRHRTEVKQVRVESGGQAGPWFSWARVSRVDLAAQAIPAGLHLDKLHQHDGRWFGWLVHQ